ncbi:MAG: glycerophosphodiester phosphodiesterase family protein [Acidobacteriota bacterium]|nr:glycerophosphodiester phosphodiesterase family protein [Acidobacteriota bacterium]
MIRPELVAHRGYPARFPENSLAGIEAALDAGARWLEVDIQLTRDGVPILFHDPDLERLCGVEGSVLDTRLDELRRLRLVGSGPDDARDSWGIPTLEESVARVASRAGRTTFYEIKPDPVERFGSVAVVERVLAALAPVRDRAVVISYLPEVIPRVRDAGWSRTGLILKTWDQRSSAETRALEPDFVFCNVKKLPSEGDLRSDGFPLAVYDVTDPERALELAERGVDLVETFAIGEMIDALGRPEIGE